MNYYLLLAIIFISGILIGRIKKTTLSRGDKPYLIRITLFKCKWFSVKLHKTLISDPEDLHDHPWNYVSIILWGGYWEEAKRFTPIGYRTIRRWYRPFSILYRRGSIPHRLIIPKGKYCITLIFTSYKWRDWGFTDRYNNWISHKDKSYSSEYKDRIKTFIRERMTTDDLINLRAKNQYI